jgi:hypothetical protein
MAFTIEQKPSLLSAANSPLVYVLKESTPGTYNGYKFRYVLKIYLDDSALVSSIIKLHKNQSNVGVFDISHIIRTYVSTTLTNSNDTNYSIHSLGVDETAKPFGKNVAQIVKVTAKVLYEVATSAETSPVETAVQATADSYAISATTPFTKTAANVGGLDVNGSNFPLTYFMNSDSAEDSYSFFTNAPTVQFVRGSSTSADNLDQLTLCFKQGDSGGGIINQGDKLEYMFVEYYNSSGAIIGSAQSFANSNANGGSTAAESLTVDKAILYFGCGTKNLETQTLNTSANPSDFADWAYYRVYGSTSSSSGARCTKYYYFYRYGSGATVDDRHQSCTRYDNVRLAWVNRLGGWDYMNFRGKSKTTIDIKNSDIESVPGTWDSATFNYNNWDRGKKTLFKTATKKMTINSDWLNEDEAVWLEELFTSDEVQILNDDYTIVDAVIVTNKNYIKKTSVNDKIKIQYTINLEYANQVRTNN